MRVLFALPGLHRIERGAEVAFTSLASELARTGDDVTLIGAGEPRPGTPYSFRHAPAARRERFEAMPRLPALRNDTAWEEASFVPGLLRLYRPRDYDITVACSFPFVHWALRRASRHRPAHVFVTQNGDWPVRSDKSEFRFFACDGLVCINPDYFERNRERWPSALIPNGVALERFTPGAPERERFGLPPAGPVVLMVSALIASKRVADGIRAVAAIPDAHLVCAGDGPERSAIDALAGELMPDRFTRLVVTSDAMPALYRSADTLLHLSLDEPFGNVFVEALASGLPVVAHDSARTRWIVGNGQSLCDTSDGAALVAAVRRGLAMANYGAADRQASVQRCGWPTVAAQYRSFFEEILARRR